MQHQVEAGQRTRLVGRYGSNAARGRNARQLVAQVPEGDDVRGPTDCAQRLGIGGDPGDGRRRQHGDEPRITAPQVACIHLGAEVGDGPIGERLKVSAQNLGARLREAAQLAHEAEQRRSADGGAEHGGDDRVDAIERIVGRGSYRRLDRRPELYGGVGDHGVDELVLAGKPIEHRLLAHADGDGDLVERHGVDAA